MGREDKNLGTKIDYHKRQRCLINRLINESQQFIKNRGEVYDLTPKEPDINLIIPGITYQIMRLWGYLRN